MTKIKILSILAVFIFLSFSGVRSASAATCKLTFDPTSVIAGTKSSLSWEVSGSFVSAKMGCKGPDYAEPTDVTDYVKVPGKVDWPTTYVGDERCSLYFDGSSTATCDSNYLSVKTTATCKKLNFDPNTVIAGGKSVLSWSVDGSFNSAWLRCSGPNGFAQTEVTDALKAKSQGSSDWPTTSAIGEDQCDLILDSTNIFTSMMYSAKNPANFCDSNNLIINSPASGGTCGSQAGGIVAYGSLSSTSPNLCLSGSVVNDFGSWCGLYHWKCGTSTDWCNAYTQGVCGSVNGTTVSSLTSVSANLCKNGAASYFTDTGSAYTWKCGKDGCGDMRSETNGVVPCQATKASASTDLKCSFLPVTINIGESTTLSWEATGSVAKVMASCTGGGYGDTDYVDVGPKGNKTASLAYAGKMTCNFDAYNSAGNVVEQCPASVTINSVPAGTAATVSVTASPLTVKPGEISYMVWTSQNASRMEVECTGPAPIARGGIQTTSAAWQADAAASGQYIKPAGAPDGYPATFTAASSTPEVCTFYPYGSDGKLGTPKSVTITVTDPSSCECGGVFSGGDGCSSGKKCDGCHCVTCTVNCSCASSTCSGSTCSNGCEGTCAGTKTGGSCAASGCGSQAEKTLDYGATLTATSPNLCTTGSSAVLGFQKWCGLYMWNCGSSSNLCRSYLQGKCGSSANSTVARGGLTATSTTLCDGATDNDKKASYFQDAGSTYTWKCGKENCGDGRSENNGVVSCQATISSGTATCSPTTPPTGKTACPGTQTTGLSAATAWTDKGTLAACTTTGGKCEYYAAATCTNWSATLSAAPTSGQSPLTVNLTADTQQAFGGEIYIYSNHSCGTGGPAPTNVDGRTFTCVYPSAGTYAPSIRVTAQRTSCANNASATVTVSAPSLSCLEPIPPASPAQPMPSRTGSTTCPEDEINVPADTHWYYVGTVASSCTTPRKCEYYVPGTNCDLTANLYAVPSTGSAPFTAYINASISTSKGPIQCSNQDCNGGTISYPYANEKCIFNCTYATAGTYNPKVHVADTVCAKDPTTRVVVNIAGTPDCDTNTCTGNSCWDGTKYIPGTKTEDCATGTATASPDPATAPGSAYLKWTSTNASGMEAACLSGPVIIKRAGSFISDAECKTAGQCTDKGYELKFKENQAGTEVCTFYPKNRSNNLSGTPFSVSFKVEAPSKCGNNIVENQEECDYDPSSGQISYVPCPTGKICKDCKCASDTITKCGNNVLDTGEDCDGREHVCPTGKTCTGECKCVASSGKIDGKCGTAARTYLSTETNWGNYAFCENGQPNSDVNFPAPGDSTTWKCKGSNGGVDSGECKAMRTAGGAGPTPSDWSVSISADPVLGNPALKVKIDSSWIKKNGVEMIVTTTKQDCGAAGVSPTNNKYADGTLNKSFECNYPAVGIYYPSITKEDNAGNEKTATTKVEVTNATIDDNCSWTASLSLNPFKNSYEPGEEIKASLYVSGGASSNFVLADQSCGLSSVHPGNISNTSFSCTYPDPGVYFIAATAKKNAGCAKNVQSQGVYIIKGVSTCHRDDPNCAARTCEDIYCFDGCERQKGTKNCSGVE
jgi:hypothetical protein